MLHLINLSITSLINKITHFVVSLTLTLILFIVDSDVTRYFTRTEIFILKYYVLSKSLLIAMIYDTKFCV